MTAINIKKSMSTQIIIMVIFLIFPYQFLIGSDLPSTKDTLKLCNKHNNAFWSSIGIGGAYSIRTDVSHVAKNISFYLERNILLYSLRLSLLNESKIGYAFDEPDERIAEISPMIGLITRSKIAYISANVGVSFNSGTKHGRVISTSEDIYKRIKYNTFGISLESQGILIVSKDIGIGLKGMGNINQQHPFYSVLFCFQFGRFNE